MFKHDEDEDRAEEHDAEQLDFEPEDEMGSLGSLQVKIKKLRDELKEAKAKRDEYLDGWQRCKADSVNVRKEALSMGERSAIRARESIIEDIIPVLDSFDMATGSEVWEAVDDQWRSGIEQIRNQLLGVLSTNGVERYGKVGDMSDHNLHEIVQEMEDIAGEPGEIVRILRYGYRAKDHILRPAQVIVKQ